jgi:predicted metal-binding protein
MTIQDSIQALKAAGFDCSLISTNEIVFNPAFRPLCEQNLCGKYHSSYACPPDCGTPEEMRKKVLQFSKALVTRSAQPLSDWRDSEQLELAKHRHNRAMLAVINRMQVNSIDCLYCGAGPCDLCSPCGLVINEPCPFPDKRYSCLSAYCINVTKLSQTSKLSFNVRENHMAFFSLIALGKQPC